MMSKKEASKRKLSMDKKIKQSMSSPVVSLLARGNNAVLNSGNIGYDTAEGWAVTREVNGMATDDRVALATDALTQTSSTKQHRIEPKESLSVNKYLQTLAEKKGNALDIVASLERNASENNRRKHLTISELLKEARKEQPIQQNHSHENTFNNKNNISGRRKVFSTSSSSSSFFETSDLDIDDLDLTITKRRNSSDKKYDFSVQTNNGYVKNADENSRWAEQVTPSQNVLKTKNHSQNLLSTYPPPKIMSEQSFNNTMSSFPKLPELDAVSPRTRRRLARLPRPSAAEEAKMVEIEKYVQNANLSLPVKQKRKKQKEEEAEINNDNYEANLSNQMNEKTECSRIDKVGLEEDKNENTQSMTTPSVSLYNTIAVTHKKKVSGTEALTQDEAPPPSSPTSPHTALSNDLQEKQTITVSHGIIQDDDEEEDDDGDDDAAQNQRTRIQNHEKKKSNSKQIKKEKIQKKKSSSLGLSNTPQKVQRISRSTVNINDKKGHVSEVLNEIETLREMMGLDTLLQEPTTQLNHNHNSKTRQKKHSEIKHTDDVKNIQTTKVVVDNEDGDDDNERGQFDSSNNKTQKSPISHVSKDRGLKQESNSAVDHETIPSRAIHHGLKAAADDIPIEVIRKSKAGQVLLKQRGVELLKVMIGDSSEGYVRRILKRRFDLWYNTAMLIKNNEEKKQLSNVKKYAYKWMAYTEIKVRKRLLLESKNRQLADVAALQHSRYLAALLIQRQFRGHTDLVQVKAMRNERKAAILLQNTERRYLAKKELKKRRIEFAERLKAVIIVQTQVRALQARHRVHTLMLIARANELLAAKQSRTEEARQGFAIVGAAITLQRFYRTSNYWAIARAYIELKKRERLERTRNWIRRWKAIVLLRRLRKNKQRREAETLHAAVVIQAYMRRWLAEYELYRLVDAKEVRRRVNVLWKQHIFGDQNDPMKPRHVFRRTPARLRRKGDPPEIVYGVSDYPVLAALGVYKFTTNAATEASNSLASSFSPYDSMLGSIRTMLASVRKKQQNKAAILINRVYRGHKARTRCKWNYLMKRAHDRMLLFQKKTNLALKVQSRYRGDICRRELMHMRIRSKIVTLQVLVRAKLAKRMASHLRMLKGAATKVQSGWRRFKCYRDYNNYLAINASRIPHAMNVQAFVRMKLSQRKVKMIRNEKRREIEKYTAAMSSITSLRNRCSRNLLVKGSYSKDGSNYRYQSIFDEKNQLITSKSSNKKEVSKKDLFKGTIQEMFNHWCVSVRPPGSMDQLTDNKFMKMLLEAKLIDDKILKRSDCDLIFAAQKESGSKTINFTQYIAAMDVIAVTLFEDVKEYPEHGHKRSRLRGRQARHAKLMLDHLLKTKTNMQFYRYLMRHTDHVLAVSCRPVQGLARRRGAAAYMLSLRTAAEEMRLLFVKNNAATTIASKLFRRYKGRCEGLRLARGFIVKMIDPTLPEDPFWWSRVSGRSSWTKPWVFGPVHDATKEVHLPPKGSEYTVLCVHCSVEKATIACEDCGESFCKADFDTLHLKGNRRAHRTVEIPNCFRCGFQTASRFCETCCRVGAEREREGEAGAYGKGCGNYCDHCFGASHPKLMAQDPTKSITKRLADAEAALNKLKLKRQIIRKEQRSRRRKEFERCRELGLLKDSEMKQFENDFDFDHYLEEEELEQKRKEQEAIEAEEQLRKDAKKASSPIMNLRKKSTLAESEMNKAALLTPAALEAAQREKETNALVVALKEEKLNLAIRLKEEDRLLDDSLLPFRSLRKDLLEEVESHVLTGAEGPPAPKRRMPSELLNCKMHRPAWLVVPCVECKGLAARWRCEQCNDIFCRPCFDFIHARGLKQTHSPVVALSWYTPFMNKKFEELCLVNMRRKALQSMAAAAARKREHTRNTAALMIQKRYRGILERRVGIPKLKQLRAKVREAWRDRNNDDYTRNGYLYQTLHFFGLAPKLPSDTLAERALIRLPAWKRPGAILAIKRNAEESVFFADRPMVCPPKDPKKKKFLGFDVPHITEADLALQASRTARRLPGTATIEFGSRFLFVTHPLMGERPEPEEDHNDETNSRPGSKDISRPGSKDGHNDQKLTSSGSKELDSKSGASSSSSTHKGKKKGRNEKKKVILGDEPFVRRSDLLYLFSEKREYYTPEDEILKNDHYKLTCTSYPVCVRRVGTKSDLKKEAKLQKQWARRGKPQEQDDDEVKRQAKSDRKEDKTEKNTAAEEEEENVVSGKDENSAIVPDQDNHLEGHNNSNDDDDGSVESLETNLKEQARQEKLAAERLRNRGVFMIELKYPWMHKSVYNVPLLCVVSANSPMKRLPWLPWEFSWMFVAGPVGQVAVQTRVDVLDLVISKYRDQYIPKLEENPTSRTNQNIIRLLKWRIQNKEKYSSYLKLLLNKAPKGIAKKKEMTQKANELENLASGTSMADVQAAKDKRKENAYMDDGDKGPAWVEEIDPSSGGTFWKNTTTGEISLEDPTNRAKSLAELTPEERKHQIAMDKFKIQKEKEKQAKAKKKPRGRR